MLDKEDPVTADGGGGGLSSSGVASPSLKLELFDKAAFLSISLETGVSSSSSASTVRPNSFLSRSVKSSRFGSGGGETFPNALYEIIEYK